MHFTHYLLKVLILKRTWGLSDELHVRAIHLLRCPVLRGVALHLVRLFPPKKLFLMCGALDQCSPSLDLFGVAFPAARARVSMAMSPFSLSLQHYTIACTYTTKHAHIPFAFWVVFAA